MIANPAVKYCTGFMNEAARLSRPASDGRNLLHLPQNINCNKLVYYETFGRIEDAIAREKQLKKWKSIME